MSKIEVSSDGRLSGEMVGIILGLGSLVGVSLIMWTFSTLIIVPLSVLIMIASFLSYKRYRRTSFDEDNLYYSTNGAEIVVPLINVLEVLPTYSTIDRTGEVYKIAFRQEDEKRTIKMVPFSTNNNFELFLNRLRQVNPRAEIVETQWTKRKNEYLKRK